VSTRRPHKENRNSPSLAAPPGLDTFPSGRQAGSDHSVMGD